MEPFRSHLRGKRRKGIVVMVVVFHSKSFYSSIAPSDSSYPEPKKPFPFLTCRYPVAPGCTRSIFYGPTPFPSCLYRIERNPILVSMAHSFPALCGPFSPFPSSLKPYPIHSLWPTTHGSTHGGCGITLGAGAHGPFQASFDTLVHNTLDPTPFTQGGRVGRGRGVPCGGG